MLYNHTANRAFLTMEWFVTSTEAPGSNSTLIKPNAFECIMEFCVKSYMANMTGGVFTERVVSEFPGLNQTLQNEPSLPNIYDDGPPVPFYEDLLRKNFTMRPPGQDTVYSVDAATILLLKTWLVPIANKFGDGADDDEGLLGDLGEALFDEQPTTTGSPEDLNHTTQVVGPGPDFARVCDIVTAYIRKRAGPGTALIGTSYTMQTYVHVQWWWAALLVALVISTFAFMLSTLIITIRHGMPIWKSSSIATLAHGLDETTSGSLTDKKLGTMEDHAKDFKMINDD